MSTRHAAAPMAAPPFILTESFAAGRQRVLGELLGPGLSGESEIAGDLWGRADAALRAARRAFHDAHVAEGNLDEAADPEHWIVQESHDGQQRPIASRIGSWDCVYKPRSVDADAVWAGLLGWFGDALGEPVSAPVDVRARVGRGWIGLIQHQPCADHSEVRAFYRRLGHLAALAWSLGSADMTGSNVVAAGPLPTLIDAEMALVPGDHVFAAELAQEFRRGAIGPFAAPNAWGQPVSFGAAGLSGVACTHRVRMRDVAGRCPWCHHVPFVDDGPCFVNGREEAMAQGFANGLRAIRGRSRELRQPSSPLSMFGSAVGRVTLRPSAGYALVRDWMFTRLQKDGRWPDVRSMLLKMPTKYPIENRASESLVDEEACVLALGDLPRFEMDMSARDLVIDGTPVVRFGFSALERARARIARLTDSVVNDVAAAWLRYLEGTTQRDPWGGVQ